MASNKPKFTCYLIYKGDTKINPLVEALRELMRYFDGKLYTFKHTEGLFSNSFDEIELNDISKSDLILIESSDANFETFYSMGLAHALGKPIIPLKNEKTKSIADVFSPTGFFFTYDLTDKGLELFKKNFKKFIRDYLRTPSRFQHLFPYLKKAIGPSYIIDIDKLNPREYENLCFELISQMGFNKVSWGTGIKEIDVVATLPKKDPDGFEYQELWLIVTGNNSPDGKFLEMAFMEPEFLVERLLRNFERPDLFSKNKINPDSPITILFILKENEKAENFAKRIERAEMRFRHRRMPFNIRFRSWDQTYMTKLIQTYPQIAFKYFSEQSVAKAKNRKSPEELYKENINLTTQVLSAKAIIEEERRKRFIAERETAWKDVAFKAAHKLGNPVDATQTFLESLKKKLDTKEIEKAKEIAKKMDISIEEAKSVISQFKSLTKIEEINAKPSDILPIIKNACTTAEEKGIIVKINSDPKLPNAFIDPDRIAECFNELVANSSHFFNKKTKTISLEIKKVTGKGIPEPLDSEKRYLKIIYSDNGCGIPEEIKEKIFSPFFTTYIHGSGLGLSMVKKIIELHDGWIIENGKHTEGVSFEIYLPIDKPSKNKK